MLVDLYAKLSTLINQHRHVPQSVHQSVLQFAVILQGEFMNHRSQNVLLHNQFKFSNSLPESQLFMLDKKKSKNKRNVSQILSYKMIQCLNHQFLIPLQFKHQYLIILHQLDKDLQETNKMMLIF